MDPPREFSPAGECPGLEHLAVFLEGGLERIERDRLEAHLTECENCRELLAEVVRTPVLAESRVLVPFKRRIPRMAWVGGGALAAAAALLLVVRLQPVARSGPETELAALVDAWGERRSIDARPSGGFRYAPFGEATRSGNQPPLSPDVRIAIANIEKAAESAPNANSLGALGVAYVVQRDGDRAVAALEDAVQQAPNDARLLADLAAAYLTRAAQQNRADDLARALASADRAVKADPTLPEGLFNHALALEALSLTKEARAAWNRFLAVDPTSGWAEEARRRLQALPPEPSARDWDERRETILAGEPYDGVDTFRRFPVQVRELVEDMLLPGWGSKAASDPAAAADALTHAELLARLIAEQGADRLALDAIEMIRRVGPDARLVSAHTLYGQARALQDQDRLAEGARTFARAAEGFAQTGSPMQHAATFHVASTSMFSGSLDAAIRTLEAIGREATGRGYSNLAGLTRWRLGMAYLTRGDPAQAHRAYAEGVATFARTGERDALANLHSLAAENFRYMGDYRLAWEHHRIALATIAPHWNPRVRHQILVQGALSSLRQDLPEASLDFLNALVDNAQAAGSGSLMTSAHLQRARGFGRLGNHSAAETDLALARQSLADVPDAVLRQRFDSEILTAEGEIWQHREPDRAIDALSGAIDRFRESGSQIRLAQLLLQRGRAYARRDRHDLAEPDFRASIDALQRQQVTLRNDPGRLSHLDNAWDAFGALINHLALVKGAPDLALEIAEQSRARALLDEIDARRAREPPVAPTSASPSGTTGTLALYYVVLPERLFIWVVDPTRTTFHTREVRASDLERSVKAFRAAIARRASATAVDVHGAALYDLLVAPFVEPVPDGVPIVVIPDGVLHALPFAALRDRRSGATLVERHPLEIAPSLAVFERASQSARHMPRSRRLALLAVGNPRAGDQEAFAPLPAAEREAREIALLYDRADVLTDVEATKRRFLAALPSADVVHFAGHAVPNVEFPLLSRFLMAPDREDPSGQLFLRELASVPLGRPRLVVLAACATGLGATYRGEGVVSLARPFLAAGVPAVVVSLWDVRDASTHELFGAFHRAFRARDDPARALREAQLLMIRNGRPAHEWAAFTVIGGTSDPEHANEQP
jgi:CHAT domain-containing protein